MSLTAHFNYCLALKSEKKAILRFYKSQRYSASFIGLDQCYLVKINQDIIAAAIVSQLKPDNQQYFLHALVVQTSYQKQGIASQLLTYILQKQPRLICFASPKVSSFYKKANWQQTTINQLNPALQTRFLRYQKTQPQLAIFSYHKANSL